MVLKFRGGAVQFFGTERHHTKWLRDTETYKVKGCFAMTELGHGSNVCDANHFSTTVMFLRIYGTV